jgi:predicted enzyme related to lactoylglutathione lyase
VPGGPALTFQPVPEPKVGKTRVHLDLRTGDLPAAVARVRALGGDWAGEVHVYDEGTVAVMADPEGTEFCLLGPPGSTIG